MKRTAFCLLVLAAFVVAAAGVCFAVHPERTKGTVTKVEAVEFVITVKDEKGRETKITVKDIGDITAGDRVVIEDGKVMKEVEPITGGYK